MENGQYIWRTVGDNKVRSEHAVRDGKVFSWTSPPPDGHPGEAFGCRCWAEPVKQASTGLKQEVISSLQQSSQKWTDKDFKEHFFNGKGRGVTLSETGWLVEIIFHAKKIIFERVEKQVADQAKVVQSGNFSDIWERSYDFEEVVFSIGNAVIRGRFNGTVKKEGETLIIDALAYYLLDDEFTDPLSIRQTILRTSDRDILPDNIFGDIAMLMSDGPGTAYSITGTWTTRITGSIKV